MEKTIENIKKILHIGAGSKVEKKNGKIHSHGSTTETQKMNHQAVTTSVEINRGENKRYQNIKIQMRRTQPVWMFFVKIMMTGLKACLF